MSEIGGVNRKQAYGLLALILVLGIIGGGVYLQLHGQDVAPAAARQAGASRDEQCVIDAEKMLTSNYHDQQQPTAGTGNSELSGINVPALQEWAKSGIECLKTLQPEFYQQLSAADGSIVERLGKARELEYIKWNPARQAWTIKKHLDEPASTLTPPATSPAPALVAQAALPLVESCVVDVEAELFAAKLTFVVDKKNILKIIVNGRPEDVPDILKKAGPCLKKFRPDFMDALDRGLSSGTDNINDRLSHTIEAYLEDYLLVMKSGGKPGITQNKQLPGSDASIASRGEPPEHKALDLTALATKLADVVARLDAMLAKPGSTSQIGVPVSAMLIAIALLLALTIGFLAAHFWLHVGQGRNRPLVREQPMSASNTTTIAMLKTLRDAVDGVARQQVDLRSLVERQPTRAPQGRATADPYKDDDRTEGAVSDSWDRIETARGRSQQGNSLVQGRDPIEDYKRLQKEFFPSQQRRRFQDRWQAQPVIQVPDGSQYVLKPADTEDEAVMWVLTGAQDGGGYPVVLAPPAYEPRMAESNGRPLLTSTHAFFSMASQTGARAAVEHPAWVKRDGQREVYICIEQGVLRA